MFLHGSKMGGRGIAYEREGSLVKAVRTEGRGSGGL